VGVWVVEMRSIGRVACVGKQGDGEGEGMYTDVV
jgi:hypothetical protein